MGAQVTGDSISREITWRVLYREGEDCPRRGDAFTAAGGRSDAGGRAGTPGVTTGPSLPLHAGSRQEARLVSVKV